MRGRIGLRKATVVELLSVISLLWFTADRGLAQNDSGTRAPVPVIRNITIQRENVFSQKERHDGILGDTPGLRDNYYGSLLAWLVGRDGLDAAGWANRLHFKTTAPVIERDLLFKPGDKLDYSLLSETERNLRALPYLRNATVSSSLVDSHTADVNVFTQDSWTTVPRLSFSLLGSGHTTGSLGIEENNLFGLGKQFEILHSKSLYRSTDSVSYDDAQLWGTHWSLNNKIGRSSDGHVLSSSLQYPFWALEIPNSAGVSFSDITDTERLFSDGASKFNHLQRQYSAQVAHALIATADHVRRVTFKFMNQSDHFEPLSSSDYAEASLRNRAVSQFSVDILDWRPDFVKAYYLDQLGHPEDRDLGTSFDLSAGYSPAALGASRSDAFLAATSMVGGRFDDEGYLWFGTQLSGRQGSGKFREVIGGLEMLAYQRIRKGRDQTLVADARIDWSAALSRDRELLAGGGDGGLRGYPINDFTGTRRAIFHFEDRTPIVDDLFHLLSVGAVGFIDAGQVWGRGRNFGLGNFAASVGVGLRLAITRSARQIPLRIDFAIPLTGGGRPFDISSGSGQAFDPFASPFAPANNATHSEF